MLLKRKSGRKCEYMSIGNSAHAIRTTWEAREGRMCSRVRVLLAQRIIDKLLVGTHLQVMQQVPAPLCDCDDTQSQTCQRNSQTAHSSGGCTLSVPTLHRC